MSLLLSSIWVQATSVENGPENFEAMAHTYAIALLFTRFKVRLMNCILIAMIGFVYEVNGESITGLVIIN